jgi:hypothetical protein
MLNQPTTTVKYATWNTYKIWQSEFASLPKQNNKNTRDVKLTSMPRSTAHTDWDAWNVADHTVSDNVHYLKYNQQHACIVGNRIRLATEAAKYMYKICFTPKTANTTGTRKRKPCRTRENRHTHKQPEVVLKYQKSQQATHKNTS